MPMIATTSATRTAPSNSGSKRQRPTATMKKANAHIEFSIALAKYFLVSTACHEKHSAIRINGTITHAAFKVVSAPVIVPSLYRAIAHCAAKQISATVATDRPIMTLDSQVSNRQMRWTSARGRNDLNAQPKTYAAQRKSISSVPDLLPRPPARGASRKWYSENQAAILMALT